MQVRNCRESFLRNILPNRSNRKCVLKLLTTLCQPAGEVEKDSRPILSFTASRSRCLQPRYRSVVCTLTCPSKNWICSSSPPDSWQSRAHVRRKSCGASLSIFAFEAHSRTMHQTTFSVIPRPQMEPVLLTHRYRFPLLMFAAVDQMSMALFTHIGIGT